MAVLSEAPGRPLPNIWIRRHVPDICFNISAAAKYTFVQHNSFYLRLRIGKQTKLWNIRFQNADCSMHLSFINDYKSCGWKRYRKMFKLGDRYLIQKYFWAVIVLFCLPNILHQQQWESGQVDEVAKLAKSGLFGSLFIQSPWVGTISTKIFPNVFLPNWSSSLTFAYICLCFCEGRGRVLFVFVAEFQNFMDRLANAHISSVCFTSTLRYGTLHWSVRSVRFQCD